MACRRRALPGRRAISDVGDTQTLGLGRESSSAPLKRDLALFWPSPARFLATPETGETPETRLLNGKNPVKTGFFNDFAGAQRQNRTADTRIFNPSSKRRNHAKLFANSSHSFASRPHFGLDAFVWQRCQKQRDITYLNPLSEANFFGRVAVQGGAAGRAAKLAPVGANLARKAGAAARDRPLEPRGHSRPRRAAAPGPVAVDAQTVH
jgi:hypothetical protein